MIWDAKYEQHRKRARTEPRKIGRQFTKQKPVEESTGNAIRKRYRYTNKRMHCQGSDSLMQGHSPQGSRGVPYLSGEVKADNYFSKYCRENSQDLTGRLNVVKFSILLQRDTTWKHLCERWTNGYGRRIPRRYDYENRRIDLRQITG